MGANLAQTAPKAQKIMGFSHSIIGGGARNSTQRRPRIVYTRYAVAELTAV